MAYIQHNYLILLDPGTATKLCIKGIAPSSRGVNSSESWTRKITSLESSINQASHPNKVLLFFHMIKEELTV